MSVLTLKRRETGGIAGRNPRRFDGGAAAVAACLCFAAVAGLQPIRSFDLFWHLAAGRFIVEQRTLPAIDPFRFTSNGAAWSDHSWLSQVGLFVAERMIGLNGLVAAGVLASVLVAALLVHGIRKSGAPPTAAALIASLAIFGTRPRLMVRPELASLVGLALLLVWLEGYRARPAWRRVGVMALFVALWANLHPGVIVAPVVALVFLIGCRVSGAEESRAGQGTIGVREIVLVPLALAAAILATPAGTSLYAAFFRIRAALEGLPVVNPEWMHAWEGPWQVLACGIVALALLIAVAAVGRGRIDPPTAFVAAILAAFAVESIRNQGLFFIGAAFAAGAAAADLFPYRRPSKQAAILSGSGNRDARTVASNSEATPVLGARGRNRIASGVAIATSMALAAWCIRPPESGAFRPRQARVQVGTGLEAGLFPVQAANFLAEHPEIGPLYNDVAFGGYLIWRLYPPRKIFLDGRNEVDSAFLRDVALARAREDHWMALLDQTGIDAALVQYRSGRWKVVEQGESGSQSVAHDRTASQVHFPRERFALIQWDDAGMLFVRRTPERAARLEGEEFSHVHPEDPESALIAARKSQESLRAVIDELDRHDRKFGISERSAWIRAGLARN